MRTIKIVLPFLFAGFIQMATGLPLAGLGVGFVSGTGAGMIAGALFGAFFSGLPMGKAWIMAAVLGVLAGKLCGGRINAPALSLRAAALSVAQAAVWAAACILMTGAPPLPVLAAVCVRAGISAALPLLGMRLIGKIYVREYA